MKKILALLLFIALASTASATYYIRSDNAQRYSSGGQVLVSSYAQIWVYTAGTATLATIYSNSTGSTQTQPVTADRYGNFSYYANPGYYDETIVGPTGTTTVYRYSVPVGIDKFNTASYGSTLASAATITPTGVISHITGTADVNTIVVPFTGFYGSLVLIPDGLFTTSTTSGNIALSTNAVVNKALIMTYDSATSKWYPSY